MSAPDTNTRKQTRRHRPALLGIAAAVAVAVVVAVVALVVPRIPADEQATPVPAPQSDGASQGAGE